MPELSRLVSVKALHSAKLQVFEQEMGVVQQRAISCHKAKKQCLLCNTVINKSSGSHCSHRPTDRYPATVPTAWKLTSDSIIPAADSQYKADTQRNHFSTQTVTPVDDSSFSMPQQHYTHEYSYI